MRTLENLTAVVTGASGGMGREIVKRLSDEGVKLMLLSNDKAGLDELKASLPGEVLCRECDVRNEKEVEEAFAETAEKLGAPDILINLAGLSIPAKIWDMDENDFDLTLDVNVKGTFLASKHFARVCDPVKGGQIVSIGSMAAKRANGNAPLYCTAKAAVNMLSSGMAIQFKERNIRVTTLNPGGADTPFWGSRPVKRENLLKASDIADVMLFVLKCETRVAFSDIAFESFNNL